jgi:hypothetical protein
MLLISTVSEAAAALSATGRGRIDTPAPPTTSATMASRWSVSTPMRGSTPAAMKASSSMRRVDVPGGGVMSGNDARAFIDTGPCR